MSFCDYCDCEDCINGTERLYHAKTKDGSWICDVCYTYDVCMDGPDRNANGPCTEKHCKHRPILISDWIEFSN